jgi:enterochelin esterase-like enzyme
MMKYRLHLSCRRVVLLSATLMLGVNATAQNFARRAPSPDDTLSSPGVLPDNRVLFRLYAPRAEAVSLNAGDIPQTGRGMDLAKRNDGIWEATLGPLDPGAYRYRFVVDSVQVVDPHNASVSESNGNVWSLLTVPGSAFMDSKDVPRGAVSEVTYYSRSLQRFRRMHVYTPPGYESGRKKYPVFYLLHGAFDCDDSWTSVGRAGFILDNLIAEKSAEPMVVVMPAGHTGPFRFGAMGGDPSRPPADLFLQDFTDDIMPYTENHYRVIKDRAHRAIAGLSMGGSQTLNLAFVEPERFGYIGVFSSGIFGIAGGGFGGRNAGPSWEEQHAVALDDAALKKGLKLVWFATGREDFLLKTSQATVEMLEKHGFHVVYSETPGAHTWINWRQYLRDFARLLFR